MIITVLTDDPGNWFISYGERLVAAFNHDGHDAVYVRRKQEIRAGEVCFLLSCSRIVPPEVLARNKHNIVVHASDLPKGKGFAPVKWLVLEGGNRIPLTLFEAVEAVDAGPWYLKDAVELTGHELLPEIHDRLANKILEMCRRFINDYETMTAHEQSGEESFYRRMKPDDDRIDPEKSIAEQWNAFRISDNELYPRWFMYRGRKYLLRIDPADEA